MEISLFRSCTEPAVFGFTADPTGCNLPAEFGPWLKAGAGTAAQTYAGDCLDGIALSDPIIRAVDSDGFYLTRSGVTGSSATGAGTLEASADPHAIISVIHVIRDSDV